MAFHLRIEKLLGAGQTEKGEGHTEATIQRHDF